MKENRLNWTDSDWAAYLGCPVTDVPKIRKLMRENFKLNIERDEKTGKYYFSLLKRNYTPAGFKRMHLVQTPRTYFATKQEAIEDANNYMSEQLFPVVSARLFKVPQRSIQMVLLNQIQR